MQKFEPVDPENIPEIDYYLDGLKGSDGNYPKRPNHSDNLTAEGCIRAGNLMAEKGFGKILEKSTELMYGK